MTSAHIFSSLIIRWLKKQPLAIARCHERVVIDSNSLYLIGGCTELDENEHETGDQAIFSLDRIDKYDIRQDTWTTQAHMQQARHDLCAEIMGMIYLLIIPF